MSNESEGEVTEVKEQKLLLPWVSIDDQSPLNKDKDDGLVYLNSIKKFYIYKNIQIFDKLFDSTQMTTNCLTVRNRYFQQIYYIGSTANRKPGRILPFTLRVVDQYNRFVIQIRKHLKPCFGGQSIDIECPPGKGLAKMVRNKKNGELFLIYGFGTSDIKFRVTRNEDKKNKNEFKIQTKKGVPIASISKRYERILATDKSVVYEDHYIRINIEDGMPAPDVSDKAIILSATLIVNIYFMNRL